MRPIDGNAAATAGTVTYASPVLTWTGTLAAGATATITFSVTVSNPDTGDHLLAMTLTSAAAGNNCPAGSTDPRCAVVAGGVADDLSARAPRRPRRGGWWVHRDVHQHRADPVFRDHGRPEHSDSATMPLRTAMSMPPRARCRSRHRGGVDRGHPGRGHGHHHLHRHREQPRHRQSHPDRTALPAAPGNNCPAGGTDPRCSPTVTVLTPALSIAQTPSTTAAVPGQVIGFTVTVTDTGQTSYTGAVVTDVLC